MGHAVSVLGGWSLAVIIIILVILAVVFRIFLWPVIVSRKEAQGMAGLEKRLDHSEKKDERKKKGPRRPRRG